MKQYCVYCNNMVCGNGNYCNVYQSTFSDAYIKSVNACEHFDFNKLNALNLTSEYKPKVKKKNDGEQLSFLYRNKEQATLLYVNSEQD